VCDSIKANFAQKRLEDWKQLLEARLVTVETTLEVEINIKSLR
jgi:hypothetical protein